MKDLVDGVHLDTGPSGTGPSATTRLAAVIGSPIRHSLSPAIHNAAFRATALDWTFVAFEVADGDVPRALGGMRSLGIDGLSVTMPHKDAAADGVDELTAAAAALHAVNCVQRIEDRLIGHNTDGEGFLRGLAEQSEVRVAGAQCVVLGAGGAARAIVAALASAGAADVAVVNRTAARAASAAELAGPVGRVGTEDDIADAVLLVNATSVGMGSDPEAPWEQLALPVPATRLHDGLTVADIVMKPVRTPLLRAAEAVGAQVVDGVSMLVHQAAIAFTIWTEVDAPVDVMTSAARAALR